MTKKKIGRDPTARGRARLLGAAAVLACLAASLCCPSCILVSW
ncbi:MAG: hypothetical protein AB1726_17245 [Planctomycetota bacterium]